MEDLLKNFPAIDNGLFASRLKGVRFFQRDPADPTKADGI